MPPYDYGPIADDREMDQLIEMYKQDLGYSGQSSQSPVAALERPRNLMQSDASEDPSAGAEPADYGSPPAPSSTGWRPMTGQPPAPGSPDSRNFMPPTSAPPKGGAWSDTPMEIRIPTADVAPSEGGLGTEVVGGLARAGAGFAQQLGHVASYGARQIGKLTDEQKLNSVADAIDGMVDGWTQRASGVAPQRTISQAADEGVGGFANWLTGKTVEGAAGVVPLAVMAKASRKYGLPMILAYGAITRAVEEARNPNATPESVATAAGIGFIEMGVPVGIIHSTAGQAMIKRMVSQGGLFAALGVGGQYAHGVPGFVAGRGYEAPSAEQVGESAVVGGATGAVLAPAFGARSQPAQAAAAGAATRSPAAPPARPEAPHTAPGPRGANEQGPPAAIADPAVRGAVDDAVNPKPLELTPGMEVPGQRPPLDLTRDMEAPGQQPVLDLDRPYPPPPPPPEAPPIDRSGEPPPPPPYQPPPQGPGARTPFGPEAGLPPSEPPVDPNRPPPPPERPPPPTPPPTPDQGPGAPRYRVPPEQGPPMPTERGGPGIPPDQRIPPPAPRDTRAEDVAAALQKADQLGLTEHVATMSQTGRTVEQISDALGSRLSPAEVLAVREGLGPGGGRNLLPAPSLENRARAGEVVTPAAEAGQFPAREPGGAPRVDVVSPLRAEPGQARATTGRGEEIAATTVVEPTAEVPGRPGTKGYDTGRWRVEQDHLDPNNWVAKDTTGKVYGEGNSPMAAFAKAEKAKGPKVVGNADVKTARQSLKDQVAAERGGEGVTAPAAGTAAPVRGRRGGETEPAAAPAEPARRGRRGKAVEAEPAGAAAAGRPAEESVVGAAGAAAQEPSPAAGRRGRRTQPVAESVGEVSGERAAPKAAAPTPAKTEAELRAELKAEMEAEARAKRTGIRERLFGRRGEGAVAEEQPAPETKPVPPGITKAQARAERVKEERQVSRETREVITEATEQRQPRMATRGTPIEEVGTAEGRVEPVAEGLVEARASTTTDKNRRYSDALHDYLEGNKDLSQVQASTARPAPKAGESKTRGRPRTNADMIAWLRNEAIPRAEKYDKADQIFMKKAEKVLANPRLSEAAKNRKLEEISQQMQTRVKARGEKVERERRELPRLVQLLKDLMGDTAGTLRLSRAARRGEIDRLGMSRRNPTDEELTGDIPKDILRRSEDKLKIYRRVLHKAPANDRIRELMEETDKSGNPHYLHDYLRVIADDPVVKISAPDMAELAKRYIQIIPDSTWILSADAYAKKTGTDPGGTFYSPIEDLIVMRPHGTSSRVEAMLHEATHAGTSHYFMNIHRKITRGEDLTSEEATHWAALKAIKREILDIAFTSENAPYQVSPEENRQLFYAALATTAPDRQGSISHAISEQHHEIASQVMSNPFVKSVLGRTKASSELKSDLSSLGFKAKIETVWDAFKQLVKSVLGIRQKSVLDKIMDPMTQIVEAGARFKTEREYGITGGTSRIPMAPERARFAQGKRLTDRLPTEEARRQTRLAGDLLEPGRLLQADDQTTTSRVSRWLEDRMPGASRAFMRAALPASPTHLMARWNMDVVPQGEDIARTQGRINRTARDYYQQWGDQVKGWINQMHADPELGKVMDDATQNRVHLGRDVHDFPAYNAHLTPEEMTVANTIKDRFANLSDKSKDVYEQRRDWEKANYIEERNLEIKDLLQRSMPDATDEQISRYLDAARTRAGRRAIMQDPGEISRVFSGQEPEYARAVVRDITRIHDRGYVEGDYFPRQGNGDFVLTYGDPNTPTFKTEFFDRSSLAAVRRRELIEEGQQHVSQVLSKRANPDRKEFVPESVFEDVMRAMSRQKDNATGQARFSTQDIEGVKDAFAYAMLRRASHSASTAARMRRNYRLGGYTDQATALANNLASAGSRRGYLIHGAEEARLFREARQHVQTMERYSSGGTPEEVQRSRENLAQLEANPAAKKADIDHLRRITGLLENPPTSQDTIRAREVLNSFEQRRTPFGGDDSSAVLGKAVGKLTKASFIYHLVRPAHLPLQVADAWANGQSFLGAAYGHGHATAAMAKAAREALPATLEEGRGFRNVIDALRGELSFSRWNMSDALFARFIKANPHQAEGLRVLKEYADDYGLIDNTLTREVQMMSQRGAFDFSDPSGGGGWRNVPSNMMNLFAVGEHTVDATNRAIILKAGFDLALKKNGGDIQKAAHDAVRYASDAMTLYGRWNAPPVTTPKNPMLRGWVPATMQYKRYGIQMYGVMASYARDAAMRGGPEGREAIKALTGLVATHSLLAGVTPNAMILPVVAVLGAWDYITGKDRPHNYETDLRQLLSENLPEPVAKFLSRGGLGMMGLDQSHTFRLVNMVDVPAIRDFTATGLGTALMQAITGASGSVAGQLFEGGHELLSGNYGRAAAMLAPRIIGDPIKAYMLNEHGVVNRRGQTMLPAARVDPVAPWAKALGFVSEQESHVREQRATGEALKHEVFYQRQRAIDNAVLRGDMSLVRRYNANPEYHAISPIKPDQIRAARIEELKRRRGKMPAGMDLPDRPQARRAYERAMNFQ